MVSTAKPRLGTWQVFARTELPNDSGSAGRPYRAGEGCVALHRVPHATRMGTGRGRVAGGPAGRRSGRTRGSISTCI
eukprot:2933833-Prymnesium_polylepis.1